MKKQLLDIQKLSQPIQAYGYADHVDEMIETLEITTSDEEDAGFGVTSQAFLEYRIRETALVP